MNRDRSKNITLSQTSFAGGNKQFKYKLKLIWTAISIFRTLYFLPNPVRQSITNPGSLPSQAGGSTDDQFPHLSSPDGARQVVFQELVLSGKRCPSKQVYVIYKATESFYSSCNSIKMKRRPAEIQWNQFFPQDKNFLGVKRGICHEVTSKSKGCTVCVQLLLNYIARLGRKLGYRLRICPYLYSSPAML